MNWFSRRKEAVSEDRDTFLVPEGTVIYGNIEAFIPCTIAGQVIGDVSVKGALLVAATAEISGQVNCSSLLVFGRIRQGVLCDDKVYIGPGGFVNGKITAPVIEVDENATVSNDDEKPVAEIVFDQVVRTIVTLPKVIANEDTWF